MKNEEVAKNLFQWNTQNLIKDADLKKSEISNFFANDFRVKANGREYEVNHENYFDFLNQFRSNILSIRYELGDFIASKENVVIPLQAHIIRTNNVLEVFDAILILKFDQNQKIILWHEVYVKL